MRRIELRLLAAFLFTLSSAAHAANSATTPAQRENPGWLKKHEAINARVREGNVDLLWIGDSIVEHWAGVGKSVWARYYEPRHAANLGIGGDCTEHVLWRLDHGNIDNISPKLAIVMIGQNNGHHNTADEIGEGVVAIVNELRAKLPETKILLLAIFFRGEKMNEERLRLARASEIASKTADGKHVFYLDVNRIFLNPDGSIPKQLMPDFEHPSLEGHRVWAEAIEPKVAELLGDTPIKPVETKGE